MDIVDRGDMRLAARLYLWNSYLAATVQRTTGIVEVLLRNVIDTSFAQWNSGEPRCGSSEWIEYPEAELAKIVLGRRNRSRGLASYSDVSSVRGIPTHDDLVAGLFGSWVRLLPNKAAASNLENPRHVLWEEAIAPHLYQDDWVVFTKRCAEVLRWRNRASHHRPLIFDLKAIANVHQACIETARMMNPGMGAWIKSERWILLALEKDPRLGKEK
ncbi:hypothetical protein AZH46_10105 [Corynebacterium striatum]|uniref:hypothetical protein n=1 Tax=Corynebacterium striatum TaxID=43770 RepID=UPI000C6750EC|nr:hypothetical protein [Corynebacterium striatum]PIS66658.1 hypothetical protein AZH46_10105 [Corynebacterium striatum]PXY13921.1 hypothetical protein CKF62_10095 [Corynebacterium striatum]